jgi:hypothetical protein
LVIFEDETTASPLLYQVSDAGDLILTSEISQTTENSNVFSKFENLFATNDTTADDAGDPVDFALAAAGASIQTDAAAGTRLTETTHPTPWELAGLAILIGAVALWKRATLFSWKYRTAYRNGCSNRYW